MRNALPLRLSMIAGTLGAALAAHAAYAYSFVGGDGAILNLASLSYTSTALIAHDVAVASSGLGSPSLNGPYWPGASIVSVEFLPSSTVGSGSPMDVIVLHTAQPQYGASGSNYWYFAAGTFSKPGQHAGLSRTATLSITPVPEPTTIAALGLGALTFVRRRRRG